MRSLKFFAVTIAMLLCCITSSAETFTVDGIKYSTTSESTVSIVKDSYSGDIVIPSTVTWNEIVYNVTSIDQYAFQGKTSLTSISLPESITSIGSSAFDQCSSLTDIHLASIASWLNIEFKDSDANPLRCNSQQKNLYLGEELITDLVVPEGVTAIPDYAFYYCDDITSISLPEGLTSIGSCAFQYCSSLTSISLPESITSIGSYAFLGCTSLTSISLPEGLTSIGSYAFSGCTSLTSISLPEGLTSIGSSTFNGCSNMTSISLPEGLTSIGSYAFNGCSSLTDIHLANITSWCNIEFYTNSYNSNANPLRCNSKQKNLYLGEELITDLVVPEGVTAIPDYAFYYCYDITSISLPEGVTSIGSYAFYNCTSLTSISLPESLTSIGSDAFFQCSSLTDIHLACISSWLNIEFKSNYTHPLRCNSKQKNLYLGEELITDLVVPEGVTAIPDYAFYYCDDITSISLPEGLTSIGSHAFYQCSSLTSISLPEGLTSIGSSAFNGCTSLTSISLPESLTSIGSYAFSNCSALGELHLLGTTPPALTSTDFVPTKPIFIVPEEAYDTYCAAPYWADIKDRITTDALCTQSVELTAAKDKSDLQVQIGDDKLRFVTDLAISGTINSYDFMILRNKMPLLRHLDLSQANIVANSYEHYTGYHTEDSIFPAYGLYNCNLITLSFPASIKSIEIQGLSSNDYLREISIHEGVTSIGSSAFYGCSSLTSVNLPEGLTSIGSSAFSGCSSLTSISLPESITSIGSHAFQHCFRLTSISLPESLTSIGSSAFFRCTSLTSVKLSPNLKTIGSSAFYDCSKLTEIHIPASVRSIGDDAFSGCI